MSVPKKKRTKSSVRERRSHHALKPKKTAKCPQCKKAIMSHRACPFCGYYKGREAVKIKTTASKNKKS